MTLKFIAEKYAVALEAPREGGYSKVYKARDMSAEDQPVVAAKIFHSPSLDSQLIRELFLRETEALKNLRHDGIVTMLDSGFDVASGGYIILEWLENPLPLYLKHNPPGSWDAFADTIVIPVLEALAHAHGRHILHRDVKPDNILVTADGKPKLADFSIAKLLSSLRLGMTVQQFGTQPFTAPERGKEDPHPREDLFAFGMTILACRLPQGFNLSHDNIPTALQQANLPRETEEFVSSLVSLEPSHRPYNAEVALRQLRRIQQVSSKNREDQPTYYLTMREDTRFRLAPQLGCAPYELNGLLLNDLAAQPCIDVPHELNGDEGEYWLRGESLNFKVHVPELTGDQFVIDNVSISRPSLHERRRSEAFPFLAKWVFQVPPAPSRSADDLDAFREKITDFVALRRLQKARTEQNNLYQEWDSILNAKYELERLREAEVTYREMSRKQDKTVEFTLHKPPSEDITGQERRVRADENISGYVADVTGSRVTFIVTRGSIEAIPFAGALHVDRALSNFAIRRQREALNLLRSRQSVRSDLGDLLTRPEDVRTEPIQDHLEAIQANLDHAKWQAVHVALSSPDLSTVEGPPGTGKTTWIAETICQFIIRYPQARVLLSGQTHISVDHALAKVHNLRPSMRVCRVKRDDLVAAPVEPLLYKSQLVKWRQDAHIQATRYLQNLAESLGISQSRLHLIKLVEDLASTEAAAAKFRVQPSGEIGGEAANDDADPPMPDLPSVLSKRKKERGSRRKGSGERQELIEWEAQADAEVRRLREQIARLIGQTDLSLVPLDDVRSRAGITDDTDRDEQRLVKLARIQADWHRTFGVGQGFEDAFLSECNVVAGTCLGIAGAGRDIELTYDLVIIEEASKATPTEALVPMVKGKRWILVGDQQQLPPFTDDELARPGMLNNHGLTRDALQRTLFDRLVGLLPPHSKTVLSEQHRMAAPLGNMISECFYKKALRSSGEVKVHPIIYEVMPQPITWFTTSGLADRFERKRQGTRNTSDSTSNHCEAAEIFRWLTRLEVAARKRGNTFTVGILSGYAAQKDELARLLRPDDTSRWRHLVLDINTIDAFQGREVDIAVLSVTRSNSRNELGHMSSIPRINVALSRGKFAVAIFGDSEMCGRSNASTAPLMTVLNYIAGHREDCRLMRLSKT